MRRPARKAEEVIWHVRVPIEIEEAPCFFFSRRVNYSRYVAPIGKRTWEITGDGHYGLPRDLAQRVYLALLALYEKQPRRHDGLVFYSRRWLAEMLGDNPNAGGVHESIKLALRQLEGVNLHVTGMPLPGTTEENVVRGRGGEKRYFYRLLEGGAFEYVEERAHGQLVLLTERQPYREFQSVARLSGVVQYALENQLGRTVPDWVLQMRNGYAVRLTRLLGKRANRRTRLPISAESLCRAIPALDEQGQPMAGRYLGRNLARAHEELIGAGFLKDAFPAANGSVWVYDFDEAQVGANRPLEPEESDAVEWVIATIGQRAEQNRRFYERCLRDGISSDRLRGALSECLHESSKTSVAARLGRRLQDIRDEIKEPERADVRARILRSLGAGDWESEFEQDEAYEQASREAYGSADDAAGSN